MMNIGELCGVSKDPRTYSPNHMFPDTGAVGVEIELENSRWIRRDNLSYWTVVRDESLRNGGMEYRFAYPLSGQDIINAMEEWKGMLDEGSREQREDIQVSERTGLHVHLDVRDLSIDQLGRVLMMFLSFREILFKISGNRKDSKYCVSLFDAFNARDSVNGILAGEETANWFYLERYADFNLESIRRFGSMEVRIHEGTYDPERILNWVRILSFIKNAALVLDVDVNNLPTFVSETGYDEFIARVFPTDLRPIITYDGWEMDLIYGIRETQDFLGLEAIKRSHNRLHRKKKNQGTLMKNLIKQQEAD